MKAITYLAYIIFWAGLLLGGSVYLAVWKGIDPWWIGPAIFVFFVGLQSPQDWAFLEPKEKR
ncbi:MAG TPA: hypothetical protein VGB07_36270 [Blastocatellia bacterium]